MICKSRSAPFCQIAAMRLAVGGSARGCPAQPVRELVSVCVPAEYRLTVNLSTPRLPLWHMPRTQSSPSPQR